MQPEEYLETRIENQIKWFSKKSSQYQKTYRALRTTSIVLAVSIPFFTGILPEGVYAKIILGGLGVAIAIIESLLGLNKYEEKWIEYRSTAETLKREKFFYLTRSDKYQEDETSSFKLLVQVTEGILGKENANWAQIIKDDQPA